LFQSKVATPAPPLLCSGRAWSGIIGESSSNLNASLSLTMERAFRSTACSEGPDAGAPPEWHSLLKRMACHDPQPIFFHHQPVQHPSGESLGNFLPSPTLLTCEQNPLTPFPVRYRRPHAVSPHTRRPHTVSPHTTSTSISIQSDSTPISIMDVRQSASPPSESQHQTHNKRSINQSMLPKTTSGRPSVE